MLSIHSTGTVLKHYNHYLVSLELDKAVLRGFKGDGSATRFACAKTDVICNQFWDAAAECGIKGRSGVQAIGYRNLAGE